MPDPYHKAVDLRLCHHGTIFHCSPLRNPEEGGGYDNGWIVSPRVDTVISPP